MTWRDIAACRDHPEPELWYPLGHKSRLDLAIETEAKAICAGCPVMAECLADADDWGIRAGLNEDERRALKRRNQPYEVRRRLPAPHGTNAAAKAHYRVGEKPCSACNAARALADRIRKERKEYARRGSIAPGLNARRVS